jgi:hypothetical protein
VVIPAGLTWLLQPLDTHVFAGLKRSLALGQQEIRAQDEHGVVGGCAWIDVLEASVRDVLVAHSHSHAFSSNGLIEGLPALRDSVRDAAGVCFLCFLLRQLQSKLRC